MAILNGTVCRISQFHFICFPELNSGRYLLSIPLAALMLSSLVTNSIFMIAVYMDPGLQQPMYYFLSMLAAVDILMCIVSTPTTLNIFWFEDNVIDSITCFTQMYFINTCIGLESALFLILAFDRYISICHPFRYPIIMTPGMVIKASLLMLARSLVLSLPLPFLAAFLNYCSSSDIVHCFCETQAVVMLSSSDHTPMSLYRLTTTSIVLGSDLLFIIFSYAMIIQAVLKLDHVGAAMKACRTCSSHLILILFFYSTIITILVSNHAAIPIPRPSHVLLSLLHHLVPPALNPIVYGIRTKEIRLALRRLLGRMQVFPRVGT
ncbi:olfactory receptor 56A4-like [Ambystoma mexicanum]|uniref:olfactory receptor 56A4-like n=1 Tax=Ambystoma mexicanum TaxID=8296 RepID=UPI0037E7420D